MNKVEAWAWTILICLVLLAIPTSVYRRVLWLLIFPVLLIAVIFIL